MKTKFVALFALATMVSANSQSFAKSKIDASKLIDNASVEAIIGKLKGAPKPDTGLLGESIIKYENMDGQWVNITVYDSNRWGLKKGETSEMKPTALKGLGDEAFWVQRGTSAEVYVKKGANILEVDTSGGIKFGKPIAEKALANVK